MFTSLIFKTNRTTKLRPGNLERISSRSSHFGIHRYIGFQPYYFASQIIAKVGQQLMDSLSSFLEHLCYTISLLLGSLYPLGCFEKANQRTHTHTHTNIYIFSVSLEPQAQFYCLYAMIDHEAALPCTIFRLESNIKAYPPILKVQPPAPFQFLLHCKQTRIILPQNTKLTS